MIEFCSTQYDRRSSCAGASDCHSAELKRSHFPRILVSIEQVTEYVKINDNYVYLYEGDALAPVEATIKTKE